MQWGGRGEVRWGWVGGGGLGGGGVEVGWGVLGCEVRWIGWERCVKKCGVGGARRDGQVGWGEVGWDEVRDVRWGVGEVVEVRWPPH